MKNIDAEIKRQAGSLKLLRKRKTELEQNIVKYLEEKEQPGLKFQGEAIIIQSKSARKTKKKGEKLADSLSILENYGIHNAEKVLSEILEAQRGEEIEVRKIKTQKIK